MTRRPRQGNCVYCGAEGDVTRDHVPPSCLFPPEDRINLITVPACAECHESFKLDDEYFRVTLSLRADLDSGAATEFIRAQTAKTLSDPKAAKFREAISAARTRIAIHSPAGIYLGEQDALKIDGPRIRRFARRNIFGLYRKFFRQPLPQNYDLSVTLMDWQTNDSAIRHPEVVEVLTLLGRHGQHKRFGSVVDIWCMKADDDEHASIWSLTLHGAFGFVAYTVPRDA